MLNGAAMAGTAAYAFDLGREMLRAPKPHVGRLDGAAWLDGRPAGRAMLEYLKRQLIVKMDISNHRNGTHPLDLRQGVGRFQIGHRTTDYFAPDVCNFLDLGDCCRHITSIGTAHRLHGAGSISADRYLADMNLSGNFFHGET